MRVVCIFDIDLDTLHNVLPIEFATGSYITVNELENIDLELRNLRISGFKVIQRAVVENDTDLSPLLNKIILT